MVCKGKMRGMRRAVLASVACLVLLVGVFCCAHPTRAFAAPYQGFVSLSLNASETTFSAPVQNISGTGAEKTVSCTFHVTGERTCEVIGDGTLSGARAVDKATDGTVIIPETVTFLGVEYTVVGIGDYAFGGTPSTSCTSLTEIVLSDTITSFGKYAFCYCNAMTSIDLPSSLTTIGDHAFYYATALESVTIPASVTSIDSYAFCRCSALRTVEFEGAFPSVANYVFTGGGMNIVTVLYARTGPADAGSLYNSENAPAPAFFYAVRFYGSQADAQEKRNVQAIVYVSSEVRIGRIDESLNGTASLYSGRIPSMPEGFNAWYFDATSYNETLDRSYDVYPVFSESRDLSTAKLNVDDASYTGLSSADLITLADATGLVLERASGASGEGDAAGAGAADAGAGAGDAATVGDYTLSFERKVNGEWQATTDDASPGEVRVTATAVPGSRYTGSISATYTISFEEGCVFASPVQVKGVGGSSSQVLGWFRVASIDGSLVKVSVAQGSPAFKKYDKTGKLLGREYPRAVPVDTRGWVEIPDEFVQAGYTCTVEGIDASAFGSEVVDTSAPSGSGNLDAGKACSALTGVTVALSVQSIGANAFRGCVSLQSVEFKNNGYTTSWGQTVFKQCTGITEVIWRDKRADNPYLFADSSPLNYYTVTYYADATSVVAGKALGAATLSENVTLALAMEATSKEEGLFDGEVPAYPSNLIDDGKWYAPVWVYPEVNRDNTLALRGTLSDSTYAYAAQINDAYTVADAYVRGLDEGAQFDYTGLSAVDPSKVEVYTAFGVRLTEGVDYKVSFERASLVEEGAWEPTDDVVNGGNLRFVVTGMGKYSGSMSVGFSIVVSAAKVGTTFLAPVYVDGTDGTTEEVNCTFVVTSTGAGGSVAEARLSKASFGSESTLPASHVGVLRIPEAVLCQGGYYAVTDIAASTFSRWTGISRIEIPDTVKVLGNSAFSDCSAVESVYVGGASQCGSSVFARCTNLASVEFGPKVYAVGETMFSGCTKLLSLSVPADARLEAFALQDSSINTLALAEGTTSIGTDACANASSLCNVELPSTLKTIGARAFSRTAIERLDVGANVKSIGSNAFAGCSKLTTVVFEANANTIAFGAKPFADARNIAQVVYRQAMAADESLFDASTPSFYVTVRFFVNEEAANAGQDVVSEASLRVGVALSAINANTLAEGDLFDGHVPQLPEGANIWGFDGLPALHTALAGPVNAFGRVVDLSDLSLGAVVVPEAYRYTGSAIDPVAAGSVVVYDVRGQVVAAPSQCALEYQRRGEDGSWSQTSDLTSAGRVRIAARAVSGAGYCGEATGSFVIAKRMPGDTFTAADAQGNLITYKVASVADEVGAGSVAVGTGATKVPAVSAAAKGEVTIPELAYDEDGWAYAPVEISDYAFYRCTGVTAVTVPSQVARIGAYAFAYEPEKTDTETSNLARVTFNCDMSKTAVATNAFLNCDEISTVVYGSKRGIFDAFPTKSVLTRYFTVRYYASLDDFAAGTVATRVIAKEGAVPYSLSANEYFEGSDKAPDAPEGFTWNYEAGVLSDEDTLVDSLYAVAVPLRDDTFTANVRVTVQDGSVSEVPCTFTRILDDAGAATGKAMVGTGADGELALSATVAGRVTIPQVVSDSDGASYVVSSIGAYAFGSAAGEGCAKLSGIDIPASVTTVGAGAFLNCSGLESVQFAQGSKLQVVRAAAFQGCAALESIALPEGLETVGDSAFAASGLVRAQVPSTVSSLGKRAFADCASLLDVSFAGPKMNLELPELDAAASASVANASVANASGAGGAAGAGAAAGAMDAAGAGAGDAGALDAEADAGAEGDADDAGATSNDSRLQLIDDYTFANCRALVRVTFNANVSGLVVSEQAFEGCASIQNVVYGDKACATDPVFGTSRPAVYVTVSFFENKEAQDAFTRYGFMCLLRPTVYENRTEADVYTGTEPEVPDHYRWVYGFDTAVPLFDSAYAYADKIRYALDTSAVDPAFSVVFSVNGEEVSEAAFDDAVSFGVSSDYAVQPKSCVVYDQGGAVLTQVALSDASGDGQASVDGQMAGGQVAGDAQATSAPVVLSGEFTMPAEAVSMEVAPSLDLQVVYQRASGSETAPVTLSYDELASMVPEGGTCVTYSAWDKRTNMHAVSTTSYVPLADVLSRCDVTFEPGDSVVLFAGDAMVASFSYDKVMATDRFYYPAAAEVTDEGAEPVSAVLALVSASSDDVAAGADDDGAGTGDAGGGANVGRMSMKDSYRVLFGQTRDDLYGGEDTYSQFGSQVTSLVVLAGAANIENCTVSGVGQWYAYTGAPIVPQASLVSADGEPLVVGQDYEVELQNNTAAGTATMTFKGIGAYKGSLQVAFDIRQAVELAGADRYSTAVEAALDSYPNGSDGVVVASGAGFADALSASGLCGLVDYPLLLTAPDALPESVVSAITYLAAGRTGFQVIIVGGAGAVSDQVESQLASLAGVGDVSRLGGSTRYETSYLIYMYGTATARGWSDAALVVSGTGFADALSISPYAAYSGSPIFLAQGNELDVLSASAFEEGSFAKAVVIGGQASVSSQIESQVAGMTGVNSVVRLAGESRYDTSRKVVEWELEQGMNAKGVGVATGVNFPDGLCAGPALGSKGQVLMLASSGDTSAYDALGARASDVCRAQFFGGLSSTTLAMRQTLMDRLGWDYALLP